MHADCGCNQVLTLYASRPVVEKHNRYAFYHQSAEAIANYITDIPYKIANAIMLNTIVYFLANLRRNAGAYFFFLMTNFLLTLAVSGLYRTIASITRTSHQALVPVSLITIGLMVYTGFSIPTDYMPGWSRWMGYINPLSYVFEALMANEFHGREFLCKQIVPAGPGYDDLPLAARTCTVVGAVPGRATVNGDDYIGLSYKYYNANKWRNIGILFAFLVGFLITYIIAAEYAKPPKTKGEVLVFRRGRVPPLFKKSENDDVEIQQVSRIVQEKPNGSTPQESGPKTRPSPSTCGKPVFHWEDVCYEVKVKDGNLRILDNVDGWVQPGVTTALMVSLSDVYALPQTNS